MLLQCVCFHVCQAGGRQHSSPGGDGDGDRETAQRSDPGGKASGGQGARSPPESQGAGGAGMLC